MTGLIDHTRPVSIAESIVIADNLIAAGEIEKAAAVIRKCRTLHIDKVMSGGVEADIINTDELVFDIYSHEQLDIKTDFTFYQQRHLMKAFRYVVKGAYKATRTTETFYVIRNDEYWRSLKPSEFLFCFYEGYRRTSTAEPLTQEQQALAKPSPMHTTDEII